MSKKYLIPSLGAVVCILLVTVSYQLAYQKFGDLLSGPSNTQEYPKSEVEKDKIIANSILNDTDLVISPDKKYTASVKCVEGDDTTKASCHGGYNELLITDLTTSKMIVAGKVSASSYPFMWVNNKIYFIVSYYESVGRVSIVEMNFDNQIVKDEMDIGSSDGHVSPNQKYYVFGADTEEKNGAQYCTSPELNGTMGSSSTIRLLDLETGKIEILKSDKNIVHHIKGWSEDSKQVFFKEARLSGKMYQGCPLFEENINNLVYSINIFTRKVTQE